jgi:hypothetical protein
MGRKKLTTCPHKSVKEQGAQAGYEAAAWVPHVGANLPRVCGVITGPVVGFQWATKFKIRPTHTVIFFSFLVSIFYLIYMFKPNSDPVLNSKSKLNAQPKKISMNAHIFMITYLLTIIFIKVSAPKTYNKE